MRPRHKTPPAPDDSGPQPDDLRVINAVLNAMINGRSHDEILTVLTNETRRLFSGSAATLYKLSEDGEYLTTDRKRILTPRLRNAVEALLGVPIPEEVSFPLRDTSLYGEIVRSGTPHLANDPGTIDGLIADVAGHGALQRFAPAIRKLLRIRSVITVPLVANGRVVGLLDMSRNNPFTESDVRRFQAIAVPIALMVEFRRMYERANERDQQHRSFVEAIADTPDVGYILTAADGTIVWVSDAVSDLFGLDRELLIGRSVRQVIADYGPEMFQDGEDVTARLLATVAPDAGEVRFDCTVTPGVGRKERLLEYHSRQIRSGLYKGGRIARYTDVTDLRRAEQAILLLHEQQERILNSAGEGIFGVNPAGAITFINPAAERLLGYGAGELIGRDHHEAVHYARRDGAPYPATECPVYAAIRDGSPHVGGDEFFHRKDGSGFTAAFTSTPIREGGEILGAVVVFNDVTERRRTEEEISRQRTVLRTVLDTLPDFVYIKDSKGRFLTTNVAHARFLGAETIESVEGMSDFDFYPRDLAERFRADEVQIISTGEPLINHEEQVVDAAGEHRWFQTTKVPYRDDTGKIVGIVGIGRDATEQRNLEHQFRQAQKLESVGRLAGGVAHDFNNMMTVVTGYSDFLLEKLASGTIERESVNQIRIAADRAAELSNQLLAFSRKQILQPEVVDLNAVVARIEPMLRRLIGEDVAIDVIPCPGLGRVKADPGQLDQIIMNLAVNARDAMPAGGTLTIETDNTELTEAYVREHAGTRPGPHVLLAVSDTGVGMPPDTLAHVFEPFFTTKEVGKGTGLGLSTVYGIVKQSGGNIWVYSEPGKGTTFKIYLPRIEDQPTVAHPAKSRSEDSGGTETILLVEDEAMLRDLFRTSLEGRGYTVLTAATPDKALALFTAHAGEIALVVTDVIMPGMTGSDLAVELKHQISSLKVLFMSGYTPNAIQHNGVLEPGTPFLQKPFGSAELVRKVREVLDG